jgi:RNA polymerase sigma-70 factor (sigma-E family)
MGLNADAEVDRDFDTYVAARGARLLRAATLLVGRADAPDVLQDALVGLYRRWERVVAADKPDAYVHRTLVNAALQLRRRRRPVLLPLAASAPGPADVVGARMDMVRALATLPPRQRAVLVLAFYEDRSDAQVAEAMSCSIGTVKSQKSRALATLRTALGHDHFLETL